MWHCEQKWCPPNVDMLRIALMCVEYFPALGSGGSSSIINSMPQHWHFKYTI